MGNTTPRLGLYMPGGGSESLGGADEAADIDKVNENMQILDTMMNVTEYTYATRPTSPIPGQIIYETDTGDVLFWSGTKSQWVQMRPHVGTTAPKSPQEGYLWADTGS